MKKTGFFVFLFLPFAFLSGCQTTEGEAKLASQREILHAIDHGLIGGELNKLKRRDRKVALKAEYRALEYNDGGTPIAWAARDGQSYGTVTPGQPYQVGTQNCRQYSHSFVIKGVPQTARGSACRNEDGSWTPLL